MPINVNIWTIIANLDCQYLDNKSQLVSIFGQIMPTQIVNIWTINDNLDCQYLDATTET